MKFIREVYKTEIQPALKQLFLSIVRGIKGFFGKLLHVIENPWSSITGIASQKDEIMKAFEVQDWFSFAQGVLLVLGALAIYDSPLKNWEVVKDKISPTPKPPKPPEPEPTHTEATDTQTIEVQVLPKPKPKPKAEATAKTPPPAVLKSAKLPYEDVITINKENFIQKVHEVSIKLLIKPSWLMIVIWMECKFNRTVINPHSGTVGLIQFTISNICRLWDIQQPYMQFLKSGKLIVTPEIKRIQKIVQDTPGVEQLDKVFDYLEPYVGRMKSLHDVYLAIFYPAAIGRPDNFVLGSERSLDWMKRVYAGNENLDHLADHDGQLEVSDVRRWVERHIPKNYKGRI